MPTRSALRLNGRSDTHHLRRHPPINRRATHSPPHRPGAGIAPNQLRLPITGQSPILDSRRLRDASDTPAALKRHAGDATPGVSRKPSIKTALCAREHPLEPGKRRRAHVHPRRARAAQFLGEQDRATIVPAHRNTVDRSHCTRKRPRPSLDDDRRSRVTPLSRGAATRWARSRAGEVTEIDDFSFGSAKSSRQDACGPLNWRDHRQAQALLQSRETGRRVHRRRRCCSGRQAIVIRPLRWRRRNTRACRPHQQ